MRSTLKPYFLGGCDEDLRRRTVRTSSKDLPQQTKKTALRLDGVQISLGYRLFTQVSDFSLLLPSTRFTHRFCINMRLMLRAMD